MVSPTYFGAVADVAGLVAVCRARGVALIVDEAWGAHFRFNDALPEGALQAGADAVISGTHKLVGSLTQSAMLHVGERRCAALGDEAIAGGLALVRSTSPNSLLLASLDVARAHAVAHGRSALDAALRAASALKDEIRAIDGLAVLDEHLCGRHGIAGFDPLRVTIDVTGTGRTGHEIADALLRDADINLELITRTVLIAHLGMAEDLGAAGLRLVEALRAAAAAAPEPRPAPAPVPAPLFGVPALAPREAFFARHERLPLAAAAGRISAETIAVYPPGIANVIPGERFTEPLVEYLLDTQRSGCAMRGTWDAAGVSVRVVTETSCPWLPSDTP